MTSSFDKLAKDFIIYALSDVFPRLSVFITLPIYTRLLSVDDYAVWNLTITIISVITTILALGGESAYARYYFDAETHHDKQMVTSTWIYFLVAWSGLIVLVSIPMLNTLSLLAFQTEQYAVLLLVSLVATPIGIANTLLAQSLRNQFRAKLFAVLNIASVVLSIGCSLIGALVLNLGLLGILGGASVATLLIFFVRLWTVRDLLAFHFSLPLLGKLLRYGIPLVPSSLAYWIFISSDRVLLVRLSTTEQLGWYAVANTLASTVMAVYGAFGGAWSPHALMNYQQNEREASRFFGQTLTYIIVGFGLLAVGVTALSPQLLMVLSTPEFVPAAAAVGPLTLGVVALASTQVTGIAITLKKVTYHFATISWLIAIINVILNVVLMPTFGMMAASWTTAFCYILLSLSYLFISQRLWHIDYEVGRTIKAALLTLGAVLFAPILPNGDLALTVLIKAAYCLLYLVLIFALRIFDAREIAGIMRLWQQIQYRLRVGEK